MHVAANFLIIQVENISFHVFVSFLFMFVCVYSSISVYVRAFSIFVCVYVCSEQSLLILFDH